jgi:hypothetical protein
MPTILVTVQGPQRTIDLEIPGDTPIFDLFPLLVELSAPQQLSDDPITSQRWGLGKVNGTLLPSNHTLVGSGIVDGTVLLFQEASVWTINQSAIGPAPSIPAPPGSQVSDTGGIGIRWNKEGLLP